MDVLKTRRTYPLNVDKIYNIVYVPLDERYQRFKLRKGQAIQKYILTYITTRVRQRATTYINTKGLFPFIYLGPKRPVQI